eukprot:1805556-Ditylum_brightwellii.AAC.1
MSNNALSRDKEVCCTTMICISALNKMKNTNTAFCALSISDHSMTTRKLHMVRKLASTSSV